jgi:hypothetical protein
LKRLLLVASLAILPLATAAEARATNECRGLDVCIRVPGPWVAVPAAPPVGVRTVYFRLTCPKASIVGGLDAVLGDPTLDVHFLGALGSPVNPGITTSRSVVFVATYARGQPTTFQPLIGCIPLSGGGGRSTTAFTPIAVKPRPVLRRVRTLKVRAGAVRSLVARCGGGERLVGASYAVGFRTPTRPGAAALTGVAVSARRKGDSFVVRASRGVAVPRSARVEVQVHLLCARGPR